jgi:hypothetical protein
VLSWATKGAMVQVPYRTLYQIENIGTEPALRFDVNVTRARKLSAMDETPVAVSSFEFVPTRVTGGRRVRPAANLAPGELRRPRGRALVPPGDERLPVSSAHVRAGLSHLTVDPVGISVQRSMLNL